MINGHVETIFCDDVRREEGGKLTLVGIYSDILIVSKFPATLPKMCLWVKIITSGVKPPHCISLCVLKGEDAYQEVTIAEKQWVASPELDENTPAVPTSEEIRTTQVVLAFSPIQFDAPCTLRVRAKIEGGDLYGPKLQVGKSSQFS